jgi:hypothetical protein
MIMINRRSISVAVLVACTIPFGNSVLAQQETGRAFFMCGFLVSPKEDGPRTVYWSQWEYGELNQDASNQEAFWSVVVRDYGVDRSHIVSNVQCFFEMTYRSPAEAFAAIERNNNVVRHVRTSYRFYNLTAPATHVPGKVDWIGGRQRVSNEVASSQPPSRGSTPSTAASGRDDALVTGVGSLIGLVNAANAERRAGERAEEDRREERRLQREYERSQMTPAERARQDSVTAVAAQTVASLAGAMLGGSRGKNNSKEAERERARAAASARSESASKDEQVVQHFRASAASGSNEGAIELVRRLFSRSFKTQNRADAEEISHWGTLALANPQTDASDQIWLGAFLFTAEFFLSGKQSEYVSALAALGAKGTGTYPLYYVAGYLVNLTPTERALADAMADSIQHQFMVQSFKVRRYAATPPAATPPAAVVTAPVATASVATAVAPPNVAPPVARAPVPRKPRVEILLDTAELAIAAMNWDKGQTNARLALNEKVTRAQRIEALQMLAAALYPDVASAQKRDDALIVVRELIALGVTSVPSHLSSRALERLFVAAKTPPPQNPPVAAVAAPVPAKAAMPRSDDSSPDGLLRSAREAIDNLDFDKADSLTRAVLSSRRTKEQHILALHLRAGALYPEVSESQKPDRARRVLDILVDSGVTRILPAVSHPAMDRLMNAAIASNAAARAATPPDLETMVRRIVLFEAQSGTRAPVGFGVQMRVFELDATPAIHVEIEVDLKRKRPAFETPVKCAILTDRKEVIAQREWLVETDSAWTWLGTGEVLEIPLDRELREGTYTVPCSWNNRSLGSTTFQLKRLTPLADVGARLTRMDFYENGSSESTPPDSAMRTSFDRRTSRMIGAMLTIEMPPLKRDVSFTIYCARRDPAGKRMWGAEPIHEVGRAGSTTFRLTPGSFGWEEPGNWQVGSYNITCYSGNKLLGFGNYEIVEGGASRR